MILFKHTKPLRRMLSLVTALLLGALLSTQSAFADDVVRGHILVHVTPGTDINAFAASYASAVLDQIPGQDVYSLATPSDTTEENFAGILIADVAHVIYAEPDRIVVSSEVEADPFHLPFDRSQKPQTYAVSPSYDQINFGIVQKRQPKKSKRSLATGAGIVVAVLDSGIDFTHPALSRNCLSGYNVLAPSELPWDIKDGTTNSAMGHGTMISGLIVRLAPLVRILPIRIVNSDGKGTIFQLAKGIQYANSQHVNVINLSLSCSVNSGVLNDVLDVSEASGIVLVAASGNLNTDRVNPPAKGHGAISVSSVEADNNKSPYANYGSFVRVVAPGSNIRSTYPGGSYATWSGTSFAAPFVAAEAALILSVQPTLSVAAVKNIIEMTAHSIDAVNPDYRGKLGEGLIDIGAAIKAVLR